MLIVSLLVAFWNLAMLTSHQRSHQPMPRAPQSATKSNQYTSKSPATYSNIGRSTPSVLRQRPSQVLTPNNSVIKCGHCHNLFRSTKELSLHKCVIKNTVNNGEQKLLDLAARAEQVKTVNTKPATPRRRASPKKPTQTLQLQEQVMEASAFPVNSENQNSEDTQLIMILNQSTGELMEITAPKGMEVQDVINSLSLSQSIEDVQVETVEEAAHVDQIVQPKLENTEQETAQAIEIIEQQANEVIQTESTAEEMDTSATIMIADNEKHSEQQQIAQIIENVGGQDQAIVLPADCFNEDGSLTLDAATLSRLNLSLSVDENGGMTADSGATYIIDTSAIKE